jgi:hypothetical protein
MPTQADTITRAHMVAILPTDSVSDSMADMALTIALTFRITTTIRITTTVRTMDTTEALTMADMDITAGRTIMEATGTTEDIRPTVGLTPTGLRGITLVSRGLTIRNIVVPES